MNSKLAVKQLNGLKRLIKGKEVRLAADWPEKWQVLIATILSAVTRDEKTIEVCEVLFKKYNVQIFCSSFRLYAEKSHAVQEVLRSFGYDMEVYSIDEAFLKVGTISLEEALFIKEDVFKNFLTEVRLKRGLM